MTLASLVAWGYRRPWADSNRRVRAACRARL